MSRRDPAAQNSSVPADPKSGATGAPQAAAKKAVQPKKATVAFGEQQPLTDLVTRFYMGLFQQQLDNFVGIELELERLIRAQLVYRLEVEVCQVCA